MKDINQHIIEGRLGAEPKIQTTKHGRMAVVSIATNFYTKAKDSDEYQQHTDWHTAVTFEESMIKKIESLTKGQRVHLEGRVCGREVDIDGEKRIYRDTRIQTLEVIEKKVAPENEQDAA